MRGRVTEIDELVSEVYSTLSISAMLAEIGSPSLERIMGRV